MRKHIAIALMTLSAVAVAGDEWQSPTLVASSAFISTDPAYQLAGVEVQEDSCRAWAVATEVVVHQQRYVNRIISSIHNRTRDACGSSLKLTIYFYSAAHKQPIDPSFRLDEQLGSYDQGTNKTYFCGDNEHYGSWANGPAKLLPPRGL